MRVTTDTIPEKLARFFEEHPRVAVAFSGGVDSSYLLYAAVTCGADVRAYTVESQFRSPVERRNSDELAEVLGVRRTIVNVDALSNAELVSNPPNRCYLCKKIVFGAIIRTAVADEYPTVVDASNVSDDPLERPGMKALEEMDVLSPLRDAGLSKSDVRRLSKEAGLKCWNSPSDSCLATRIATGTPITADLLKRTAETENRLRAMGFSGIRVRTLSDGTARLELPESQIPVLNIHMIEVDRLLKDAYGSYTVKERTAS